MSYCLTIFEVSEIIFIIFFVAMSDFKYHYLLVSLYVFAISVVIVKNNLENKIIYVLSLSNTLCSKYFSYYHILFKNITLTQYGKKFTADTRL
jgi:hypothetical protein